MIALLVGAGFSKWAGGLPLACDLFDFQIAPFGVREEQRLEKVRRLKEDWDHANPSAYTEVFISSVLSMGNETTKRLVLWYIVRRLSEPYIWKEWHAGRWRRHVLMVNENRKESRPGVLEARSFLSRPGMKLSGIVTPNYDLLIEYALGTKGYHYGIEGEFLIGRGPYPLSQWRRPVQLTGKIALAKLHGSISWGGQGRYSDGRRGITGDALIVAPTSEKVPPPALSDQWRLSRKILSEANRILVFGFAFNPYDVALLDHLHQYGNSIAKVAIVDVASRVHEAQRVWPRAQVRWLRPLPDSETELSSWLRRAN